MLFNKDVFEQVDIIKTTSQLRAEYQAAKKLQKLK